MLEQALELRVQFLIVLHTFLVMALCHPFDVQNRQRHRQRIVRQNRLGDRLRRADYRRFVSEAFLKLFAKKFEELNMFSFFAGEL